MTEVGRVIGTEDAHPLEFWVGIGPGQYLQLDDVVAVTTGLPDGTQVRHYGVVDIVRSRFEGAQYDSDVFRIAQGILPADVASAAHVSVTRVEPEIFVPPAPGLPVVRAAGAEREAALYFDGMASRFIAGLSRDGQPVYGNLEFLDGSRGAHVNISGVSGVATKTTYALFLLFSLFHSNALGPRRSNARAIVFNVKGEDLLWLDKPNRRLSEEERAKYGALGLPPEPFASVGLWAPVRRDAPEAIPDTGSRQSDVTPYYWTLREFCEQRLLRFLFAEADTEASQIAFAVMQVERALEEAARATPPEAGYLELEGVRFMRFADLAEFIAVNQEMFTKNIAQATYNAFARRLEAAAATCGHLIRADRQEVADRHRIDWRDSQVSVIDLHNLHDRAKRFVVGVVVKRLMEEKERTGTAEPLVFLVLDELNKYAPREGWSPIKEVVLDIAERGRSMGVVLIGAQQTASEIERRVVANASFRVVGRLDAAEAQRGEYGFLTQAARARSSVLKPGSMFLLQPEIPVPLLVQFPFPCWATRQSEVDDPVPDTANIFRS
ncbi:MAG TPA: ATP-binding protein [Dehalococcoidia bacterium]|nr:ATP-binding protein [Dehalococcoidia bacterium]